MARRDVSLPETLKLVEDGTLTLLDRPDWLSEAGTADLFAANGGCMNAAMRLARMIEAEWTWQVGYDNRAVLTSRADAETSITVISLGQAHALLIATMQAMGRKSEGASKSVA